MPKSPDTLRAAQLHTLTAALAADGVTAEQIPPIAALLMMTGLAQVLALEQMLGVTAGHDDTLSFVDSLLARLEPTP